MIRIKGILAAAVSLLTVEFKISDRKVGLTQISKSANQKSRTDANQDGTTSYMFKYVQFTLFPWKFKIVKFEDDGWILGVKL